MTEARRGYLLKLNAADVAAAQRDLGEDPTQVASHVTSLRAWLEEQPHMTTRVDDEFLLMFLRHAKFMQLRARQVIDSYTRNRSTPPSSLFYPSEPKIDEKSLELLRAGVGFGLPSLPKNQVRIVIYRPGVVDHKRFTVEDTWKALLYIYDSIMRDPVAQVYGTQWVVDYKDIGLQHFTLMTPSKLSLVANAFVNAMPLRSRAFHFVRGPTVVSGVLTIAKTFIPAKLRERVHNHWNNLESLQVLIGKETLPEELGGSGGNYKEHIQNFVQHLQSEIHESAKFSCLKYDETKKVQDGSDISGAFRKLNVN